MYPLFCKFRYLQISHCGEEVQPPIPVKDMSTLISLLTRLSNSMKEFTPDATSTMDSMERKIDMLKENHKQLQDTLTTKASTSSVNDITKTLRENLPKMIDHITYGLNDMNKNQERSSNMVEETVLV